MLIKERNKKMALNLTIIFYFFIAFGIVSAIAGIAMCISRNGNYTVDYLILLAGITLTIIGVITIKIAKPTQTKYDPAVYDYSKIEAERDVKMDINKDGEYLMGYTFGNYEYYIHYVTPTPTPIPPDPHPEWKWD